jgi:hypothetical protein
VKTKNLRGRVSRRVTLTTNDPAREKSVLTIQGNILGSVFLLPHHELSIGSARGRHQRRRMIIRKDPTEDGQLVVSDVKTRKEWLHSKVRRVETEEPGEGSFPTALPGDWILEVDFDKSAPPGGLRTPIEFSTGLSREPKVTVLVQVSIIPAITVRPKNLLLSPAASGQGLEGEIAAVVRGGLNPEELEISATSEVVALQTEQTGPRHFRVRASMPDTALGEDLKLVFRVGDAGEVTVPILAGARSSSTPEVAP